MDEKKSFPHWMVYAGLILIVACLVGALIIGGIDNAATKAKLGRSEAIRRSVDEALVRSERSDQEARVAGDILRERIGSLENSIAGLADEVRDIGTGQDDLELAYQRFIEKLQRHGEIVDRLPN